MKKKLLLLLLTVSLLLSGCDTSDIPSSSNNENTYYETENRKTTKDAQPLSNFNKKESYMAVSTSQSWHKLEVGDYCVFGLIEDIDTSNKFWKDKKVFTIKVCTYEDLIVWLDRVWATTSNTETLRMELYQEESSLEISADVRSVLVSQAGLVEAKASVKMMTSQRISIGEARTFSYGILADGYDLDNYMYKMALITKSATLYAYVYCTNPLIGGGWKFDSMEYELICDDDIRTQLIYTEKD